MGLAEEEGRCVMRPDDCLDQDCDEVKARERERMRAEAAEYQRDEARKRIAELEREAGRLRELWHRAAREARVLRNIVQEDHPDELVVVRGLREWHAKERRLRREAERERDELRKVEHAARAAVRTQDTDEFNLLVFALRDYDALKGGA